MGKVRNVYKRFDKKPEGKKPLGKPRCRGYHAVNLIIKL
jgi:hypothetical protein